MKDVGMVMPVYNQDPNYLKLSINSVLRQTYKQFHLVVVIDGANKQTRNIVYQFKHDPRVIIIKKTVNEGISKALNTGFDYLLKVPEVKFLTWGSSDNIVYPDFIKKLRDKIKNATHDVGLVYSCFHHIDANGKILYNNLQQDYHRWQQNKTLNDLLDFSFIGTSFMYKKAFAKQIDGYYLDPVQTYDYWLRLTERCNIKFIPEELMAYRFHSPLSLSREIHTDKKKHRWWRDQFNIARHRARVRRNIPYETTILFPIHTINDETIKEIENILEQQYHNYRLFLIDRIKQMQNKLKSVGINDPRIAVIEKFGDEHGYLKNFKKPKNSFKLVYSKRFNFSNVDSLSNIIKKLKTRHKI